jgi:hypothetical protein
MADFNTSPNMNLPIPVPSVAPGPQYAENEQSCFQLIDTHNHTTGQGVQIPVAGLNIDNNLSLNGYALSACAGVTLQNQTVAPASNTVYTKSGDLYFKNGGNEVQITTGTSVVGSPGNITNLVSPASVTWVSGSSSYVFRATGTTYGDLDFRNAILRNAGTSPFKMTVAPPGSMATDYTVTLPTPPAVSSFLLMDGSGTIATTIPTALGINTANIANSAITDAKLATDAVTTIKIQNSAVTPEKISQFPYLKLTANTGTVLLTIGGYQNITTGTFTTTTARNCMIVVSPTASGQAITTNGGQFLFRILLTSSLGTHYSGWLSSGTPYNIPFGSSGSTSDIFTQMVELPGAATYTASIQWSAPTQNLLVSANNYQFFFQTLA